MRKNAVTSRFITLSALSLLAFCTQAEGSSLAPDGIAISTHRAGGGDGMYCLDAATGREVWKVPSLGNELTTSGS